MPMSPALQRRRHARAKPADAGRLETVRGAAGPESIGYLVRYAYRAFVKVLAVELDPHDITTSQWSVLRVLWQEEGMSQVELAHRMMVEKASLTPVLESMTGNRLIVRSRNSDDRRKVNIFLTARGRQLKDIVLPSGGKINKKATRGMSAAEVDQLRDLLSRLITNLKD